MRGIRKSAIGFVVAALALAIGFASLPVLAQTPDDVGALHLTTSPLPINLVAQPGETVKSELRVKNGGTKSELLKTGLLKFSAYGEEGKPELKDRENGDDYFDWVTFSEDQFSVAPGEWHTVTMTINLPADAALGYYYAVTFSRVNPPKASATNKLQGGTAILVLLEAKVPNAKRELKIDQFKIGHKIYEFLPADFSIRLKNTGNIHLASTGNIFIKKGNRTIATLDVNQGVGNILPGSKRIFAASWDDGYPIYVTKDKAGKVVLKNGKQVRTLHWDSSKISHLRMGKYTATVVMTYDSGQRDIPLEASVVFWVIPWRLILVVTLPLLAVLLLIYKYIRLRGRVKKQKGTA